MLFSVLTLRWASAAKPDLAARLDAMVLGAGETGLACREFTKCRLLLAVGLRVSSMHQCPLECRVLVRRER